MFCNVAFVKKKDNPTKWRMFFIAFMIIGICNIIFCAINLSIVTTSNMDILIMTSVQTGLVLAFSIICTFCCVFCNYCTDFNKSGGGASDVNVQIQQQRDIDREARIEQNRMQNMASMYQMQIQSMGNLNQQAEQQQPQANQPQPFPGMQPGQQFAYGQQPLQYNPQFMMNQQMMQQMQLQMQMQMQMNQMGQLNQMAQMNQMGQMNGFNQMGGGPGAGFQQQGNMFNPIPNPGYVPGQPMAAAQMPQSQPHNFMPPVVNNPEVVEQILNEMGINIRQGQQQQGQKFNSANKDLHTSSMMQKSVTKEQKKEQTAKDENTCPICLCDFEVGDDIIVLKKCQHQYHKSCIKDWISRSQQNCPLCRTSVSMPEQWKNE